MQSKLFWGTGNNFGLMAILKQPLTLMDNNGTQTQIHYVKVKNFNHKDSAVKL